MPERVGRKFVSYVSIDSDNMDSILNVNCTIRTVKDMAKMGYKGVEEARNQIPGLLEAAQQGTAR